MSEIAALSQGDSKGVSLRVAQIEDLEANIFLFPLSTMKKGQKESIVNIIIVIRRN